MSTHTKAQLLQVIESLFVETNFWRNKARKLAELQTKSKRKQANLARQTGRIVSNLHKQLEQRDQTNWGLHGEIEKYHAELDRAAFFERGFHLNRDYSED